MPIYKIKNGTKDGRNYYFRALYTNIDGTRKQYKSKKFTTRQETQEAESNFILKHDKYLTKNASSDMTFSELIELYFEYQTNKVKLTTFETYEDRKKYFECIGKVRVKDLDINHFEHWKKKMYKYDISNGYRNYIYKFFKAILNYGMTWHDLDFSHMYRKLTNFTDPNEIKKEMLFYTIDEFKQFISVVDNLSYTCFFKTLYYCGLRKGEAKALNWKDIDFNNMTISTNKTLSENVCGQKYVITSPKTKTSNRILPIPLDLQNSLKQLYEEQQIKDNFNENWFVFGNKEPLKNDTIRSRKNKYSKLAKVKQIRIHDFRHSTASLLINSGANITIVAKYLGHAKVEETLNTYSHLFKGKMDEILNIINQI